MASLREFLWLARIPPWALHIRPAAHTAHGAVSATTPHFPMNWRGLHLVAGAAASPAVLASNALDMAGGVPTLGLGFEVA